MPIPAEAVGSFGDIGGSVNVVLRWHPDPDEVEAALLQVAGYLDNLSSPLRAARRILQDDIRERFETETDPEGHKWHELDEDYLAWKVSHGFDDRILRMTGDLYDAATAQTSFIVDSENGNVFMNTANLPPYWIVHQEGSPAGLERRGLSKKKAKELGLDDDFGGGMGAGQNTPARPFIGVSADAEEMIFNAFDIWFYEGIQVKVSSAGIVQHSPGGRFGAPIDLG